MRKPHLSIARKLLSATKQPTEASLASPNLLSAKKIDGDTQLTAGKASMKIS
jgi:hypothetical protein